VDPAGGSFASGLETGGGVPKQSFDAWRMPLFLPSTSTRHGRSLEVWGGARPTHFATGRQQVSIEFRTGSRGAFKTLQKVTITNKRGYFDIRMTFPSSGQVRLSWHGLTSRTQNIRVR
jgi:hypothetical protein